MQEFKHQLLVTCGSRVEMYEWRGPRAPPQGAGSGPGGATGTGTGTLEKHAFYDLPSLVTSLSVIKDYLLAADVTQGLYFMRYSVGGRLNGFAGLGLRSTWRVAPIHYGTPTRLLLHDADR